MYAAVYTEYPTQGFVLRRRVLHQTSLYIESSNHGAIKCEMTNPTDPPRTRGLADNCSRAERARYRHSASTRDNVAPSSNEGNASALTVLSPRRCSTPLTLPLAIIHTSSNALSSWTRVLKANVYPSTERHHAIQCVQQASLQGCDRSARQCIRPEIIQRAEHDDVAEYSVSSFCAAERSDAAIQSGLAAIDADTHTTAWTVHV